MSSKQSGKPAESKLPRLQKLRRISGRKRNLLIIVSGVILGASTQYLATHVWFIGNCFLSMFINWILRDCQMVRQRWEDLCGYVYVSYLGMAVELVALIVVILFIVFFFKEKPDEERAMFKKEVNLDFSKMTPKQIVAVMDRVKDMSSAQIETFLGGEYAKAIEEAAKHTRKGTTETQKENKEKGGKT